MKSLQHLAVHPQHKCPLSLVARTIPSAPPARKVKRTPKDRYRPTETTPLFQQLDPDGENDADAEARPNIPWLDDEEVDSSARIVTIAIYVNFVANVILLIGKALVVLSVPSVSVLASLVDAALDFLSTVIVWVTHLADKSPRSVSLPGWATEVG